MSHYREEYTIKVGYWWVKMIIKSIYYIILVSQTYIDGIAQKLFSFGTVKWILLMSQSLFDQFIQIMKLMPPWWLFTWCE